MTRKFVFALILAVFGLVVSLPAQAVDFTVVNQKTISWAPVTKTTEGNDIPAGDTIKYQVWLVQDQAAKDTAIKVGPELDVTSYTITFTAEGRWLVGVEAIRIPAASTDDVRRAPITWSDSDDTALVPAPFGFIYFEAPAQVGGLGPS